MEGQGWKTLLWGGNLDLPQAYFEGAEAAEENGSSNDCPYRVGLAARTQWLVGFADGLEDDRKVPQKKTQKGGTL